MRADLPLLLYVTDVLYTVNETECGRGEGPTRGSAMEAAAESVLVALGLLRS